eukprot:5917295-Prymnesium_polylepis.1
MGMPDLGSSGRRPQRPPSRTGGRCAPAAPAFDGKRGASRAQSLKLEHRIRRVFTGLFHPLPEG